MPPRESLSRRTLLRGAGVALALPWLEAMWPRSARAARRTRPPVRLAVLMMPNGVREDEWDPRGEGRRFELSSTLQPLADLRDRIVVFKNLFHRACLPGDGHYVKTAGFLTGTTITKTVGIDLSCNGISMDQLAAQRLGRRTPIPSLVLGIEPVHPGIDTNVGYTLVYAAHLSWAGPTRPLAKEIQPRLVYERLFRAAQPQAEAARQDRPLLDLVLQEARRLRDGLGASDARKMDEYLESVRDLERRLEDAARPQGSPWKPRAALAPEARPAAGTPPSHQEHCRLMLDMIALAFQTDTTRIATFMFGNSVSMINMSFMDGVTGAHHSISHHGKKAEKLRQMQIISRWHVEQFAYLLRKLRAMKEGGGTVLDSSLILFGSDLRDGDRHDPRDLPLVLAGGAGGRIRTGQYLVSPKDTPLSNLFVAMLDAFGAPVERFADSTGPLPQLLG